VSADEIRHAYQGSPDLQANILAEIAAQLAELNAALASLMTSPADGITKQLAVWTEGRP
jgi:hypothetical protein